MTRNVWFQLVDAATRDAYADTQQASVSSDGVSNIGDHCDVIQEEYRHDVLESIAATQLRIYSNRAEYDKKKGRPLGKDSPLSSLGEAERNPLIVVVTALSNSLRLIARTSYPPFLKKAVEITNVMLARTRSHFEAELEANETTRKNLREVVVKFHRANGPVYGWTDRSKTTRVISVNEVLLDREKRADGPHEYQCIVFVVAATIFHECAHLTLRWRGVLESPPKFGHEVGNYMEAALFRGVCGVKIQQSNNAQAAQRKSPRRTWTKEMPILDVVIRFCGPRNLVVREDHLNKFFTKGKLCDKALFPLDCEAYQETEGAVAFRSADHEGGRKRRRTSPEDPNIMIPPLCGISKNRHPRRKLSM
eukprot:jgi/Phyca11/115913/e_gw1.29.343.1